MSLVVTCAVSSSWRIRHKLPALTELSDYAGQLLWAHSRGDKHWVDYEKQERQNLEQRGEKALQALEDWAKNQ